MSAIIPVLDGDRHADRGDTGLYRHLGEPGVSLVLSDARQRRNKQNRECPDASHRAFGGLVFITAVFVLDGMYRSNWISTITRPLPIKKPAKPAFLFFAKPGLLELKPVHKQVQT
jgi:hypothetical protein